MNSRALIIITIITTTNIKGWSSGAFGLCTRLHKFLYFSFRISLRMLARFRCLVINSFSITVETRSLKGRTVVAAFVVVVATRLVSVVPALTAVVAALARILSLTWV